MPSPMTIARMPRSGVWEDYCERHQARDQAIPSGGSVSIGSAPAAQPRLAGEIEIACRFDKFRYERRVPTSHCVETVEYHFVEVTLVVLTLADLLRNGPADHPGGRRQVDLQPPDECLSRMCVSLYV